MTKDSPDFQLTITVDTVAPNDSPDWQITAVGPGGASVGGYKSLTGPGETATPGDLTQAGGFTVNDTVGDGIELYSNGPVQVQTNLVGKLAFFNGTPVVQQPLPTTLAEVISYLANYNLWQGTITTPTIVNGGTGWAQGGADLEVAMSGAPTAGNDLFCWAGTFGTGPLGLPAGFDVIASAYGYDFEGAAFYPQFVLGHRKAVSGDPSSWTFSGGSPATPFICGSLIWEISGVARWAVGTSPDAYDGPSPVDTSLFAVPASALGIDVCWAYQGSLPTGMGVDNTSPDTIPAGWAAVGYVESGEGIGLMGVSYVTVPSTANWSMGFAYTPSGGTHLGAACIGLGLW